MVRKFDDLKVLRTPWDKHDNNHFPYILGYVILNNPNLNGLLEKRIMHYQQ